MHAFRIIDDAIAIAYFGLDRPIQIHTIDADGKVEKLSPEDLKGIEDVCETWRQLEREDGWGSVFWYGLVLPGWP